MNIQSHTTKTKEQAITYSKNKGYKEDMTRFFKPKCRCDCGETSAVIYAKILNKEEQDFITVAFCESCGEDD